MELKSAARSHLVANQIIRVCTSSLIRTKMITDWQDRKAFRRLGAAYNTNRGCATTHPQELTAVL